MEVVTERELRETGNGKTKLKRLETRNPEKYKTTRIVTNRETTS